MKKGEIKERVFYLLENIPEARNMNDRELFILYLETYNPMFLEHRIEVIFRSKLIPNIESVGRMRRKIQEEHPTLRPRKDVALTRADEEEKWREWSHHE